MVFFEGLIYLSIYLLFFVHLFLLFYDTYDTREPKSIDIIHGFIEIVDKYLVILVCIIFCANDTR